MLAKIEKKSLLRVLAAASCSAIISLAALTVDTNAEASNTFGTVRTVHSVSTSTNSSDSRNVGNCLYSAQLASDPALKAEFTSKLNAVKGGLVEENDNDTVIYVTNIDAGGASSRDTNTPSKGIDSLSNGCLSCHDGVMAKDFNVRIKNDPNNRVMSLIDIIGGHPVGMEYEKYVAVSGNEFRGEVRFSNEMIFAEGKIGCLTCHNPLNDKKGHLVMKNDRDELCFACHNK